MTAVLALPLPSSRLSCGRPARRRKAIGRQSVPARAQHSASFKAITARQLQALVRRHASPRALILVRAQGRPIANEPDVPEWIDKATLTMGSPRHRDVPYLVQVTVRPSFHRPRHERAGIRPEDPV